MNKILNLQGFFLFILTAYLSAAPVPKSLEEIAIEQYRPVTEEGWEFFKSIRKDPKDPKIAELRAVTGKLLLIATRDSENMCHPDDKIAVSILAPKVAELWLAKYGKNLSNESLSIASENLKFILVGLNGLPGYTGGNTLAYLKSYESMLRQPANKLNVYYSNLFEGKTTFLK